MNNTDNRNPSGKKTILLASISALLGLAMAGTLFMFIPNGTTSAIESKGINSTKNTNQINGVDMPNADEIQITDSDRMKENNQTIDTGNENDNNSNSSGSNSSNGGNSANGSSGGSSGGSNSGGSNNSGYVPAPEPAPIQQNYCPGSRGENPTLWDSCRAGYVAPTIQFGGVTSCYPIDKNAGIWSITWTWQAVGGNWNGVWNGGQTFTSNYYTSPGEAHSGPILIGESISMTIYDMNGWGYKIDEVYGSFGGVQMNTVCR